MWVISKSDLRAAAFRHPLMRCGHMLSLLPWTSLVTDTAVSTPQRSSLDTSYPDHSAPWTRGPKSELRHPAQGFQNNKCCRVGLPHSGCLICVLSALSATNYSPFLEKKKKKFLKALVLLQTAIICNESSPEGTSSWSLAYFLMVLATE